MSQYQPALQNMLYPNSSRLLEITYSCINYDIENVLTFLQTRETELGKINLIMNNPMSVSGKITRQIKPDGEHEFEISIELINDDDVSRDVAIKMFATACRDGSGDAVRLPNMETYLSSRVAANESYARISQPFKLHMLSYGTAFRITLHFEELRFHGAQQMVLVKGKQQMLPQNINSNVFAKMYEDEAFKDLKFIVDGEVVKAHKCVVAARCDVLRAMLISANETVVEEDSKDLTREGVIAIQDTNIRAFKAFLKYLYTNTLDDAEVIDDVLVLSDKYDLSELKTKCANMIIATLNEVNAVENLIKGHLHSCDFLKQEALRYICINITKILEGDYLDLLNPYPTLLKNIIQLVGSSNAAQGQRNPVPTPRNGTPGPSVAAQNIAVSPQTATQREAFLRARGAVPNGMPVFQQRPATQESPHNGPSPKMPRMTQ